MKKLFIIFITFLSLLNLQLTVFANNALYQSISPAAILKPYKNITLKKLVINKLKKQTKNLPQKDKNIVSKYVFGAVKGENTFLLINSYLRGNLHKYISKKDINKPLQMRLKMYADQISGSVSKGRLPQNMLLYSGINEKTFTTFFPDKTIQNIITKPLSDNNLSILKKQLLNKKFQEKGFMIASYDKNFTEKTIIRFEIKAPKNLQALLIDELNPQIQKQIIINKGYEWKVIDIKKEYDKHQKQDFYSITLKIVL